MDGSKGTTLYYIVPWREIPPCTVGGGAARGHRWEGFQQAEPAGRGGLVSSAGAPGEAGREREAACGHFDVKPILLLNPF
eukprot:scaffold5732_cov116-Isochrysis_galbana.AAC.7